MMKLINYVTQQHAALFERNDVIVVASVSCIYGLGSPEEYREDDGFYSCWNGNGAK